MELALSLGDTPKPFSFLQKSAQNSGNNGNILGKKLDLGFCMDAGDQINGGMGMASCSSSDPPPRLQLDLLPFSPVQKPISSPTRRPCPPWLQKKLGGYSGLGAAEIREDGGEQEGAAASLNSSSPKSNSNSGGGSAMDFAIFRLGKREQLEQQVSGGNNNGGDGSEADRGTSSRGSDEEENGMARKKLRLSKQQSAFLEESFKEHNTLNPKQKLALAKQLNLRPRQVEVWFQNRRARTKLKQTEVDCEYLKRCCETLTEENKRLHKELQELRSLKASQPFYMQLPPTTLTMCPSCERVATTATASAASATAVNNNFSSNN